ncbi:MAG: T9SS type A sorting domain-containing protein [Candidatus Kapabacteria bacterium]|nr:T9SS type A sorting domain-containing protein [Ignavibacteriota bacterium]MCW5883864.1 T9SS type A sorting domain-containing protein [Candidatus Kapabacteria bacterium]
MKICTSLIKKSKLYLFALMLLLIAGIDSYSQSWVAEAQQEGFILKKVVSDTTIATGQPFSYTIYFTIPAGATNVTITDALPSSLTFLGHSITGACGTPTVTAPAINAMGGTFSVSWASLPSGCTGSFTISVAFPNGTTCPGVSARNNVCMFGTLAGKTYEFCTPYVSTSAIATNPWGINKYPLGAAWQGGNCQYLTANDTITYQVCVYKSVGTTGQLNLVSGLVTDTLPAGAQLVSSNCGATQSGNIITWNVGNMSANQPYNTVCCQFVVYYPIALFPNGSLITNKATLSGSLGSINQPCSNFTLQSNTTCVEKKSITSGSVSKWVYTNRQPGCAGQYLIYICNTGTTPITVNALDTLPTSLSNYSISGVWNLTASITGGIATISGTLAPGQCGYVYVAFTIPQTITVGSTVTNCVTVTITGQTPITTCNSFVVDTPAPKPCVWKEVCNKQTDYTPGSIFRYRLRIQNIGGMPITGATLTDVLNPNLEYVGNPSYYISNTWNTPCTSSPATPWTGVNLSYNAGTNTITALLDTIPATCQNIFYAQCGMYGTSGVPFYFIEVDVKVRDTSALGSIPNSFSLSGGSLGSTPTTSNIDYILVTGVVGYNLEKGIKKPSDTNYGTSTTTAAGSTVNYRLKMNSSGTAALRHVTFVDLLPLDNGTADSKILIGCASRGSQFDIPFSSFTTASPTVASFWNNTAATQANVNLWTPTGAPGASFTNSCGTAGSWSSGAWAANQKNLGAYFGSNAIGAGGATIDFDGLISSTAKANETACNSFAVSGWTKHLIQSSIPTFQLAGQLESPLACATIDTVVTPEPCIKVDRMKIECAGLNADGNQNYGISLVANSCTPATLLISSPDGTFSPASFTFASSPWTMNTTLTYTSTNNPIMIYYTLICENEVCRDSIMLDVPHCDNTTPVEKCCEKFTSKFEKPSIQTNNSTGFVGLSFGMSAGPAPIQKFSATIVSAQLRRVCNNSVGAWTRIFGDITGGSLVTPPAAGPQLLSIFSREAIWGPGECVDWTRGANVDLKMIYPPFSGNKFCRDTLMFKIRYSFTDCECNTCDTLITYTVVRKMTFLPWDWDLGDIKLGDLKNKLGRERAFQSDEPASTSIVMDNANTGDLWIISPDDAENNTIITGVELRSHIVPLLSLSSEGNQGYIEGDVAYIPVNIVRGQSRSIKLSFDNKASVMQFPVIVRYIYQIENNDEVFYTDQIEYIARVPDATQDRMDIDIATRPEKVSTFALYFSNTNGYKESIAAIGLKPANGMKVLAIGPANIDGEDTYMIPRKQDDGSYIITSAGGTIGVPATTMVKPIYITLSGVPEDNATVEFTTYDINANAISMGSIVLSNPISKVFSIETGNNSGVDITSIVPNPASGIATITFTSERTIRGAKLSIMDVLGRELIILTDDMSVLERGIHVQTVDVSKLTAGIYYVTLQTADGTVSKAISIVR